MSSTSPIGDVIGGIGAVASFRYQTANCAISVGRGVTAFDPGYEL